MPAPRFKIDRSDDVIDVKRSIELVGLVPGETVRVHAETHRADGSVWRAEAAFTVGPDGRVSVAEDPAISGSYSGVSPMGLVWSQRETMPPDASRTPAPQETIQ